MTNKEKREYLNLALAYSGSAFIAELEKRNDFHSMRPKKFFKFRKFDEFTFDMLEKEYVYLAPATELDDPFDCLTSISLERVCKKDTFELSDETVDVIIDTISSHFKNKAIDKKEMVGIFNACSKGERIDKKLLSDELCKITYLTKDEKNIFYQTIINFPNVINELTEDDNLKNLFALLNDSRNSVGVCALTTKKDNKVMWSLYGDTYKGYCVEYEEIKDAKILKCLKPVIYSKRLDKDIIRAMIKFSIEASLRFISCGRLTTNIGIFDELTCSKDSDWAFQDEWRIVGTSKTCVKLKTKAIYLGFDVPKEDEAKMIDCAKHKYFNVFKMKRPTGVAKVEYTQVFRSAV